jgi:hypothetical protein
MRRKDTSKKPSIPRSSKNTKPVKKGKKSGWVSKEIKIVRRERRRHGSRVVA